MKRGLALITLITILLFGCFSNLQDSTNIWNHHLSPEIFSPRIVKGIFSCSIGDVAIDIESRGFVLSLGEGYYVGLSHCFKPHLYNPSIGLIEVTEENILYRTFTLDNGNTVYQVGHEDDIIVFVGETVEPAFPIPWGTSTDLHPGDRVLSVGFSGLQIVNLREGIVSSLDAPYNVENCFSASFSPLGGDSGTPVLYFKKNTIHIAGLVYGSVGGGDLALIYKVDYVVGAIERIKNA